MIRPGIRLELWNSWTANTLRRNVSFHRVLMLVCFGGVVSLMISLARFRVASLDWLGASAAGIVEEPGPRRAARTGHY